MGHTRTCSRGGNLTWLKYPGSESFPMGSSVRAYSPSFQIPKTEPEVIRLLPLLPCPGRLQSATPVNSEMSSESTPWGLALRQARAHTRLPSALVHPSFHVGCTVVSLKADLTTSLTSCRPPVEPVIVARKCPDSGASPASSWRLQEHLRHHPHTLFCHGTVPPRFRVASLFLRATFLKV